MNIATKSHRAKTTLIDADTKTGATQTITINGGAEVELHWGAGSVGLGIAVSSCPADKVGEIGPSDGETFTLRGKTYRLGSHDYSTDQPGSEDDEECTCSAAIYVVEE